MTPEELESRARLIVGAIAVFAITTDMIAIAIYLSSVQQIGIGSFLQTSVCLTILRLLWNCFWTYSLFQGSHNARLFLALGLASITCTDIYVWIRHTDSNFFLYYSLIKIILSGISAITLVTSRVIWEFITMQYHRWIQRATRKHFRNQD